MYDQREAIDLITLQQRLKDKQLLEQVGGMAYLSPLPDAVPSAANLSYYLDIVLEKYLLRKMIHTCTEVVGRVYDYEGEVDALLDEVERDILRISEARVEGNTEQDQGPGQEGDQHHRRLPSAAGDADRRGHRVSPIWTK